MRRLTLLTIVILAMCPAVASAEGPVATSQSLPVSNPTTVTLEATAAGETEMSFAIASKPLRGSLGEISPPTCEPTGTGSTDCKATVTYTPMGWPEACSSGFDTFTYIATDMATKLISEPATITVTTQGEAPPAPAPEPSLAPSAAAIAGAPFAARVSNAVAGATANYGDGSAPQPLSVDSAGNAALSHTYASEGTYSLIVTNPGPCGGSAVATERVEVVSPGALNLVGAIAPPGGSASIAIPGAIGLSATLLATPPDQSAAIFGATYPAASSLFALAAADGQVLGNYDVRAIGVSGGDRVVVSFSFPDGGIPTAASIVYFDPRLDRFAPVRPSTLVPDPLRIDIAQSTVAVVLDSSSVPSITELKGTRFALIAAPPAISGLVVAPRCVAPRSVRSLRLHLTLSEKAGIQLRVRRHLGTRPSARCTTRNRRTATRAGHMALRLPARLRPGAYEVTVTARNIHGSSSARTTFAVAAA